MKPLADLGKRIKKKHFPDYEDLTDEECGRLAKEAYPDKYKDYEEPQALQVRQSEAIDPRVELVGEKLFKNTTTLEDYYNPRRGRFTAWWQRGKAEGRTKLAQALTQEELAVLQQAALLEQEVANRKKSEAEYKVFLAEHHVILTGLMNKEVLTKNATESGFTPEIHQEILKEKALVEIDLDRHRQLTEMELDKDLRKMQEKLKLSIIAKTLTSQQQLHLVQELLDNTYKQIEEIQNSSYSESTKARMIADREEIIQELKSGRPRLLQDGDRPGL
jgi:hypothetical protein